jgi:hypothetical protein
VLVLDFRVDLRFVLVFYLIVCEVVWCLDNFCGVGESWRISSFLRYFFCLFCPLLLGIVVFFFIYFSPLLGF